MYIKRTPVHPLEKHKAADRGANGARHPPRRTPEPARLPEHVSAPLRSQGVPLHGNAGRGHRLQPVAGEAPGHRPEAGVRVLVRRAQCHPVSAVRTEQVGRGSGVAVGSVATRRDSVRPPEGVATVSAERRPSSFRFRYVLVDVGESDRLFQVL